MKAGLIELPKICDPRGNLSFVQNDGMIPFDISRVYFLYDIPADSERGGHSHRTLHELLIATAGSFTVTVTDGHRKQRFTLRRPNEGLYIPPGHWRTLEDFSSGAVCLVLASELFREEEYVRDFDEFKSLSCK